MTGRYKMSTIVRLTGFSEALLRAWERRYRVLEPARGPGGHRFYTDEDLRVLSRIRDLMEQGRSIGEIALRGREALVREAPEEAPVPIAVAGKTELERCQDMVVEGAVTLDHHRIRQALDSAFAAVSPDLAISVVVEQAAREIGELWSAGKCPVAGEHLASHCFMRRLFNLFETASSMRPGSPRALAACLPDERHQVGLVVVSYALARAGFDVMFFGAGLPFEDLEYACDAVSPQIVCLSVTRPPVFLTHRPQLLQVLGRWAGRMQFILGGIGLPPSDDEIERLGATIWPVDRPLRELVQSPLLHSGPA